MIRYPNAKINLGLRVISKREDGFHNLESVFYPIGLCDILEIIPSPDGLLKFWSSGLSINGEAEDNLVMKAYRLMSQRYTLPALHIHLYKRIPMGAGLGGGSSDAAAALILLNQLFSLGLDRLELIQLALALGSDCPFFIDNSPSFVSGRGEFLEDYKLDLNGLYLMLVYPGFQVNTREAFKMVSPGSGGTSLKQMASVPVGEWKEIVGNDFERVVFLRYPEIKSIKEQLYKMGAVYCSMSGSGSAVFGLFSELPQGRETFSDYFIYTEELSSSIFNDHS